jgi:hypothetical protein
MLLQVQHLLWWEDDLLLVTYHQIKWSRMVIGQGFGRRRSLSIWSHHSSISVERRVENNEKRARIDRSPTEIRVGTSRIQVLIVTATLTCSASKYERSPCIWIEGQMHTESCGKATLKTDVSKDEYKGRKCPDAMYLEKQVVRMLTGLNRFWIVYNGRLQYWRCWIFRFCYQTVIGILPNRKDVTGGRRKLHNEKSDNFHSSPNITMVIKSSSSTHGRDTKCWSENLEESDSLVGPSQACMGRQYHRWQSKLV